MDPSAHPRQVASFNGKSLRLGGELLESDGEVWLELLDRVPVEELAPQES
ncbi:hypothetical protein [Aquisalimonas sp.]|nr:hypothetical protein [Aquisalimonas sp.]